MKRSNDRGQESAKLASNEGPRSLKYYLSSDYYHKIIGSLATKHHLNNVWGLFEKIPFGKSKSEMDQENTENKSTKPKKVKKLATKAEIKEITKRSNEVLASAKTVFPFTLFPDDLILDRTKITITKRDFFLTNRVISIRIEDVLNVSADYGPFFGSINIASRVLSSEDHFKIDYFWRKDVIHLKHMIQGYVIAQHNKIEVSHLDKDELTETLAELGHDLN